MIEKVAPGIPIAKSKNKKYGRKIKPIVIPIVKTKK